MLMCQKNTLGSFLGLMTYQPDPRNLLYKRGEHPFILGAAENHQIVGRGLSGSRTCEVAFRTGAGMA